jgi:hypothetical protein
MDKIHKELLEAAQTGKYEKLQRCLSKGASINIPDPDKVLFIL